MKEKEIGKLARAIRQCSDEECKCSLTCPAYKTATMLVNEGWEQKRKKAEPVKRAVLVSMHPMEIEGIANGANLLIKQTKPLQEAPFTVYMYCQQEESPDNVLLVEAGGKSVSFGDYRNAYNCDVDGNVDWYMGNRAVVGEFVCKSIYNAEGLFIWRIGDKKIYDKPKALAEFRICNADGTVSEKPIRPTQITRMCYVEAKE